MKKILTYVVALCCSMSAQAQILNDNINVEIRMAEFYGNSDNDATSTDEQSMLISYLWDFGSSQLEAGPFCTIFDCHAGCELPEDVPNGLYAYGWVNDAPYNASIDIHLHAWGDEEGEDCIFDAGDIDEFEGLASDETLINPVITEGRLPVEWQYSFGSVEDWIFYDNGLFDLKPKACWRYHNGDDCGAKLDFGTLFSDQIKTHINVNKTAPVGTSGAIPLGYTNSFYDYHNSPDVYYSFTLDARSLVTISTDNSGTDFDTFLTLLDAGCSHVISTNDDSNGDVYSEIEIELDAGSYTIIVEGYSFDMGTFELSVLASAAISGTNDVNKDISVQVGPNPSSGLVNVVLNDITLLDNASINIYTSAGSLVKQLSIDHLSTTIDLSNYPKGIYMLQLMSPQGYKVEKIMLQ